MPIQSPRSRVLYTLALFASLAVPLQAQTIDDGIMLRQHELLTGNFYSHDSWDEYWEGALKRANGNIGTITTETNVLAVNYGLFDRFNVIGNVPYVWTNASQGVLHGIQGFQDLSLAGKWTAHETPAGDGVLRTILVVAAGIPLTNYNPELLPSIGMGSTRVSWRGTVNYQTNPGWYVNGTTAYTVRSHVKATASDLAAGLALGQAVATAFVARAGADGMRTAGGSPPSTSSELMARETAEVRRYVDGGTREELAIANFWADGPSTPTPPGHWNFIALPYIQKAEHSKVRAARALAMLNMALHDAAVGCWETKYFYFNPRPSQMDPELKSIIGLPNFPSYTSGHSTFSGAAAEVLSYLFPSGAAEFERMKEEASISRLYGGIHFRSDLEVGKAHGRRIGGYTVSFARTDGAGDM